VPQRSKLTPVQRLNREGVDAIRNHRYEKAKALFTKHIYTIQMIRLP